MIHDPIWSYGKSKLFLSSNPYPKVFHSYGKSVIIHLYRIAIPNVPTVTISDGPGIPSLTISDDPGIPFLTISDDPGVPAVKEAMRPPAPKIVEGVNV